MVSAVYKKTTNLKLHFFSNDSEIDKLNNKETVGGTDRDVDELSEKNGKDDKSEAM